MSVEVDADQLREAIEGLHGGVATYAQAVPVKETFEDKPVWEGVVHVFNLAGHPKAERAYAWSFERHDGTRRIVAVLHTDAINSPLNAVRAAIVAEHRAAK
jgi:hypothetical protein